MNYWIFKSEPDEFSITDLEQAKSQTERWDGIRNYQARNFLRDKTNKGDQVLFYHSSCKKIGIAGQAEIISNAYPDPLQFLSDSKYYDSKAQENNPRWYSVDIKWKRSFKSIILKKELEAYSQLKELPLLKKGMRLSIIPISKKEFEFILNLAQ